MTRWIPGIVVMVASVCFAAASADAQVFYAYGGPTPLYAPVPVYQSPVFVAPAGVITSAYAYPAPMAYTAAYVPQPIVPMAYSTPAIVPAPAIVSPPVVVAGGPVVQRTRVGQFNYTQTTRAYGPTYGPHYARVHVHNGLFGTTVRERVR